MQCRPELCHPVGRFAPLTLGSASLSELMRLRGVDNMRSILRARVGHQWGPDAHRLAPGSDPPFTCQYFPPSLLHPRALSTTEPGFTGEFIGIS